MIQALRSYLTLHSGPVGKVEISLNKIPPRVVVHSPRPAVRLYHKVPAVQSVTLGYAILQGLLDAFLILFHHRAMWQ